MRKLFNFIAAAAFFALFAACPAAGASAAREVLDEMVRNYHRRIEKIDDYVIVTEKYTSYHKKTVVDGWPAFEVRVETENGVPVSEMASEASHDTLFDRQTFERLKASAVYEGTEQTDGFRTHVIRVDEISGIFPEAADEMKSLRIYIDSKEFLLRRMKFEVEAEMRPGEKMVVEPVITMRDYRDIEGMMVPFETVTVIEGMDEQISDAQREEIRKGLEEMDRQMDMVPPALRERMEEAREQMKKLLEGGRMEFTARVKEVRVNTGL